MTTRVLFVGNSWQGSNSRSLREALALQQETIVCDIADDHFIPNYRTVPLRIGNRLLHALQRSELTSAIRDAVVGFRPDALVVYKGYGVDTRVIDDTRRHGIATINVFPDYSPHAYGHALREAIGRYDLVISTKSFHPPLWKEFYGYDNRCVCVPHGYDPALHYWSEPATSPQYDVTMCAMWRPEYHRLMRSVAATLGDFGITVAIGGPGWVAHRKDFPAHWHIRPAFTGTAYGEFLRSGKIAIAPINREVRVNGRAQPGDEDTARSYELAAAYCFFVHQRSNYIASAYDERTEVPLWSNAGELVQLVKRWLPDEGGRRQMAVRAHARAVPAYSTAHRAAEILAYVKGAIAVSRPKC